MNGHLDIVSFLIEHNGDIDCMSNNLWTPLHYACHKGHFMVAEYLVNHGARIDTRNRELCFSNNVKHHYCYQLNQESLEFLSIWL